MRKSLVCISLVTLLAFAASAARAQTKAPAKAPRPAGSASEELLMMWNSIGNRLIAMAEDWPEDKYDFKPNPEQRSFAEQLLHIAGADYLLMSAAKGSQMGPGGGEDLPRDKFKTKADVVNILKQAVADGTALIKEQGDAGLSKEVKFPFGNLMAHASLAWWEAIEHSGEHYGQLVVYYRVNNVVPPASRPRR